MILILVRSARTQRSPSAQRINYSLRKSLLCMNSLRTLLDGSSIACLFAGGVSPQFGAWLFNRFVDRLLQRKNAIRSSSAMMIDNRKKTRGKSDSFIFFSMKSINYVCSMRASSHEFLFHSILDERLPIAFYLTRNGVLSEIPNSWRMKKKERRA